MVDVQVSLFRSQGDRERFVYACKKADKVQSLIEMGWIVISPEGYVVNRYTHDTHPFPFVKFDGKDGVPNFILMSDDGNGKTIVQSKTNIDRHFIGLKFVRPEHIKRFDKID